MSVKARIQRTAGGLALGRTHYEDYILTHHIYEHREVLVGVSI